MVADTSIDKIARVERRAGTDRRTAEDRRGKPGEVQVERRKSNRRKKERRRQIDPTTCERDYTADEIEFMKAIDKYRRESGRPFPTWSEVLEVVRALGYQRPDAAAAPCLPSQPPAVSQTTDDGCEESES